MSIIPTIVHRMIYDYSEKQRKKSAVSRGDCPQCGATKSLTDTYGWSDCESCGWYGR